LIYFQVSIALSTAYHELTSKAKIKANNKRKHTLSKTALLYMIENYSQLFSLYPIAIVYILWFTSQCKVNQTILYTVLSLNYQPFLLTLQDWSYHESTL
jgi:hypothetical protein